MQQLSKTKSMVYHLYPGVLITLGFVVLAPVLVQKQFPPQLAMMICIVLVAIPILLIHLHKVKKSEGKTSIWKLNGFQDRLPTGRLILYTLGLVIFAFVMWGLFQPLDIFITQNMLYWLPEWYSVQSFDGYASDVIVLTLILNLILNGFLAPFVEEIYFRGYLLSRMESWGKWAFVANAILFSLYHFWQPYIYLTLIFALLPMTYLVWKTRDLRLGILTHCLLNLTGSLLSFGLIMQQNP